MSTIFEQPLCEKLRTYLRLEQSFARYRRLISVDDRACAYAAFGALFELMEMTDHGDLRADLHSDLDKQLQLIQSYRNSPNVDLDKLDKFEQQLQRLRQWLVTCPGKFTAKLKDNEFLYSIKHRYALPGGTVSCDLPRLHVFLNLPMDARQAQFDAWLQELAGVRTSVEVLLKLMRDASQWRQAKFDEGYFQLEPVQGVLLRIRLNKQQRSFPEVSSGKQRCVIRLTRLNEGLGSEYIKESCDFQYALVG